MQQPQTIIDFTRYVALGDSITAGYMDGALCHYGQVRNYAYFLAQQLQVASSGNFNQCLVPPHSIGLGFHGNSCLEKKTKTVFSEKESIDVGYIAPQGDLSIISGNQYHAEKPFNNIGIPATKLITLLFPSYGNPQHGAGNFNPFFTRMASNPLTASALGDALLQHPTFFTLFVGNNDALAYALSGCTEDSLTPMDGDVGVGFEASARAMIQALTANGAKGVISNLPSLDATSYFRTIPYDALILDDTETLGLNKWYADFNLKFKKGKNALIICDSVTDKNSIRQLQKDEYILLDALLDTDKHLYLKGLSVIPKKYCLTTDEIKTIQNRLDEYNSCLKQIAEEYQLAFVDTNKILKLCSVDRVFNPIAQNFYYKQGGVFSLDGLHPNAYGHALLANEMINQINTTYNTQVPFLDANSYKNFEPPVLKVNN